jgi:hypothetical protein
MAWSFAMTNHQAPLFFDAIAKAALARMGDFNAAQDLSAIALWPLQL